jgi:hypothetical protein
MNRTVTAANVGRLFFPQSKSLGIDRGEFSTAMLDKIVYAGTMSRSFEQASKDLRKLAEVEVPPKQVERVCQRIGAERVTERDEAVAAYQKLPLIERKAVPTGVTAPDLAMVGCDGGRLQILERTGAAVEAEEMDAAAEGRRGKHWREDKVGLLQTMKSTVCASDPCPEIPECFVDPTRILKLARELKKQSAPSEEAAKETAEPELGVETLAENPVLYEPPQVVEKRVVILTRALAGLRPHLGDASVAVGILRRVTQGVRGGRFGKQLDDLAQLFFVVRTNLGFHPCAVVRVCRRDGRTEIRGRFDAGDRIVAAGRCIEVEVATIDRAVAVFAAVTRVPVP